jgi:hypothetical protein
MRLALFCAALTAFALLCHVAWWRIRLPRNQLGALLLIFLGAVPACTAAAIMVPGFRALMPGKFLEWLHVVIVYVPVSLAYVATYSAIEEDSPSLKIVRFVAEAGQAGRTRADLKSILNDDVLLGSRLQAMVRDQLVVENGGTYALTNRGRVLARVFSRASACLGIQAAG